MSKVDSKHDTPSNIFLEVDKQYYIKKINFPLYIDIRSVPCIDYSSVNGTSVIKLEDYLINHIKGKANSNSFRYDVIKMFKHFIEIDIILYTKFNTWLKYASIDDFAVDTGYGNSIKFILYGMKQLPCRKPINMVTDSKYSKLQLVDIIYYNDINYLVNQSVDEPFSSYDLGFILYGLVTSTNLMYKCMGTYHKYEEVEEFINTRRQFELPKKYKDFELNQLLKFLIGNNLSFKEFITSPIVQKILLSYW